MHDRLPDMCGQKYPQAPAGAMQTRLHGLRPDIQHCCSFGHTELLDVSQDENCAQVLRQLIDNTLEDLAKFPDTCLPLGVQGGFEAYSTPLDFVVLAQWLEPGAAQYTPARLVDCYADEPSAERTFPGELPQVLISLEVCLLNDILDFRVVAENRARHSIEALVIAAHDHFEEQHFAVQYSANDVFVRHGGYQRRCCTHFAGRCAMVTSFQCSIQE